MCVFSNKAKFELIKYDGTIVELKIERTYVYYFTVHAKKKI